MIQAATGAWALPLLTRMIATRSAGGDVGCTARGAAAQPVSGAVTGDARVPVSAAHGAADDAPGGGPRNIEASAQRILKAVDQILMAGTSTPADDRVQP